MVIGIDASRAFVGERTGTEEYAYQVISNLVRLLRAGGDKLVLYVRPNAVIPKRLRQKHVTIEIISWRYLWTQVGLARRTWTDNLDILFVPAHTLPILRRPGLLSIVTIHGLEYRWLPEYRNWLQRWYLPLSTYYAARWAGQLIAVSEATKADLIRELGVASGRIEVIPEGVGAWGRARRRVETLAKWQLEGKRYILFVGSLQPRKNLPALIEAFARMHKTYPGYKLVIAGPLGWMSEAIFAAPLARGVQEMVVFVGRVSEDDKHTLLTNALLYVQPSWTEGFGLPVLEAMASGVPCIVSSGGALPEVVGEAGVVVLLGDGFVRELAKAMQRLVRDSSLRAELGRLGKLRAKKLTWARTALLTMRLFERVYSQQG